MGPGVGLEVGNSIYFDMPADQFAYWNTDDAGREMVRIADSQRAHRLPALVRRPGHHARQAAGRWRNWPGTTAGCRSGSTMAPHRRTSARTSCTDTAMSPAMRPTMPTLRCDYGVDYVWRGRVTSIIGQDMPAHVCAGYSARGILWPRVGRCCKEAVKQAIGRWPETRSTPCTGPTRRCGRLRCGIGGRPMSSCAAIRIGAASVAATRADTSANVLTDRFLDRLVERGGTCILYTHLGKIDDPRVPFNPEGGGRHFGGWPTVSRRARFWSRRRGGCWAIAVRFARSRCDSRQDRKGVSHRREYPDKRRDWPRELSRTDLDGLTFYVSDPRDGSSDRRWAGGRELFSEIPPITRAAPVSLCPGRAAGVSRHMTRRLYVSGTQFRRCCSACPRRRQGNRDQNAAASVPFRRRLRRRRWHVSPGSSCCCLCGLAGGCDVIGPEMAVLLRGQGCEILLTGPI